jgi:tripartite ATP-independent transporter DctM subunit
MRERGYHEGFAAGTIAAGGTLGILIPPSIVMIVYAVMTEQFIITLFAAALIPAVIAVGFQFVAVFIYTRQHPSHAPRAQRAGWPERRRMLIESWRVLTLIVVVTGGIYAGVFTANEAAAVGCILAALFAWQRGNMTRRTLESALVDTALTTGMIYLLIIGASIFTYFLSVSRAPAMLVEWIQTLGLAPISIVLALMVFYIVIGCFFEDVSALVITLPFVFPLIVSLGYDPIWWGIVCVMVVEIGLITPPFGLNLFVINGMAPHLSIGRIAAGTVPFLISDVSRLLLLIFVPGLALWLPRLLGMP